MIAGKTVVYTSGTFDMLHANHIKMLEYARSLGDILIVGVNTDELVESYKSTPIIPFEERIALVKAMKYPDIVIPQHSLDHTDKVKKLNISKKIWQNESALQIVPLLQLLAVHRMQKNVKIWLRLQLHYLKSLPKVIKL